MDPLEKPISQQAARSLAKKLLCRRRGVNHAAVFVVTRDQVGRVVRKQAIARLAMQRRVLRTPVNELE
jgi:hypothetical protein